MPEQGLEQTRTEALAAAKAVILKFAGQDIDPDATVELDLSQDFGYGVRAGVAVETQGRPIESPPMPRGGYGPGAKWREIYQTQWQGVYRIRDMFKRPGDEFDVQMGANKLVKMGTQAASNFQTQIGSR